MTYYLDTGAQQANSMAGNANDKYTVDSLVYPDNLKRKVDDTSYVVFNIIVDNESKLQGNDKRGDQVSAGIGPSLGQAKQAMADVGNSIANGYKRVTSAAGDTVEKLPGGLAITSLGQGANWLAGKVGSGLGSATTSTVDFLDLAGQAVGDSLTGVKGSTADITKDFNAGLKSTFLRTKSRLKLAIVLPMPADFGSSYSAGWQENDSNLLVDTLTDPNGVAGIQKTMKDPKAVGKIAGGTIATFVGTLMPAQQKVTGVVSNPRKTQIFDSMAMREFTFNYTFAPRNQKEYETIQKIIASFKYYMHPEWAIDHMGKNSPYMRVPSEFEISFKHFGQDNANLNKITTCVLKSCTVHYTPNGTWSKHSNGAPTQIAMSLVFGELEMLTKEMIAEGY